MELEKFLEAFHPDHLVIYKEDHKHDDNNILMCVVCNKQITLTNFYVCEECNIFAHKSCTELPLNIEHPFHPDHPLILAADTFYISRFGYNCGACSNKFYNFFYHCSICDFSLDLDCSLIILKESIDHPSHKHLLRILPRTSLLYCDACGKKHEGFFYTCSTCYQYCLHRDCATLPMVFENNDYHDHPLTLAYSLPSQYTSFFYFCEICEKIMTNFVWVYHCGKCRFLVHVDCVTQQGEHFMSVFLPNKEFYSSRNASKVLTQAKDSDHDVILLPLKDEFQSLVDHFHKDIRLIAKESTTWEPIYCKGKLLVTVDGVQGNVSVSYTLRDHVKYQKELCNICIFPVIRTPYNKCVSDHQCNFILHKGCAELPDEIQHPFHSEHPLTLRAITKFCSIQCDNCKVFCNGYVYSCLDCNYVLDVICATIPSKIKHEAHKDGDHSMSLKKKISRHCNACYASQDDSAFAFHCDSCDFELHACCAVLPLTTRHKFDEIHQYKLTYRPVEDHYSDYCCDICENEINPLWWFYHCIDCDQSMHTMCHPAFDWRSNIKFDGVLKIDCHPHPLYVVPVIRQNEQCNGYVRVVTGGSLCSKCGKDFCDAIGGIDVYYPMGFKCLECIYKIHYLCFLELVNEGILYQEF